MLFEKKQYYFLYSEISDEFQMKIVYWLLDLKGKIFCSLIKFFPDVIN